MKISEVRALPREELRLLVLMEARAARRLRTVEGLWRRATRTLPGSMTAFIRHEGLLDLAGIDAIITAAARLSSEDAGILDRPISSGVSGHRLSGHAAYRQFPRP